MSTAYESPGFAAAERASLNPPEEREPTLAEENEIERRLEDRAWGEAIDFAPAFEQWLFDSEDWRGGKVSECLRVMFAKVDLIEWRVRVQIQRSAVINDYIAYRVNTFTDDERAEVVREVMG